MSPRIFVSAGEPSGDLHAGALVTALRRQAGPSAIDAMGGARLAEAGATIRYPIAEQATMGAWEVLEHVPAHVRLLRALRRRLEGGAYDLVVLVDYPGFNLRLAGAAREAGVPVLYYIAPQLWAWGGWRAGALRRTVDRLAVILPFEESYFRGRGVAAEFVGHPLVERARPSRAEARARLGIADDEPVLAVVPGSRPQEIERHWPLFRDAALRARRARRDLRIVVSGRRGERYAGSRGLTVLRDESALALAAADAALVKSGTSTLEAALADTPMAVAYRAHPATMALARRLVRVPAISLVNLVAGDRVAPEFVQRHVTVEVLAHTALELLDDGPAARRQRSAFARVRERLGGPGAAERVARLALELVA